MEGGQNVYWRADKPRQRLMLSNAIRYVENYHMNPIGPYDDWVYWQAYRVAGTVQQIYDLFSNARISIVEYQPRVEGQPAPPKEPLSLEGIAEAAIDPLRHEDRKSLEELFPRN